MNFLYQDHGDKHFQGGPKGTKFIGNKATINSAFQVAIQGHSAAIRTGGTNFDLYLAKDQTCPDKDDQRRNVKCIEIQMAYDRAADRVEYHGYPYHIDKPLGLDAI